MYWNTHVNTLILNGKILFGIFLNLDIDIQESILGKELATVCAFKHKAFVIPSGRIQIVVNGERRSFPAKSMTITTQNQP